MAARLITFPIHSYTFFIIIVEMNSRSCCNYSNTNQATRYCSQYTVLLLVQSIAMRPYAESKHTVKNLYGAPFPHLQRLAAFNLYNVSRSSRSITRCIREWSFADALFDSTGRNRMIKLPPGVTQNRGTDWVAQGSCLVRG